MKILQMNAVYNIGSTGRTTKEMHDELLAMEYDSYVACSISNVPKDERLFLIGNKFDRKFHALMSRITGKQSYFSNFETKKLLSFIADIKPDVICLRNIHANYINLPMLLEYIIENKIPTVIVLHDFWFMTGKCVHFTTTGCYKWKTFCDNCPNLQNGNPSWFFDKTKEMFNNKLTLINRIENLAVIGVSDWVTDLAKQSPVFSNAKIINRIYNWIDVDVFKQKDVENLKNKLGLQDEFIILGVAPIWCESKGFSSFIKLAEQQMGKSKVILVGSIPDNVQLPENIISVGLTHSVEELVDYYNLADVLVTFSNEETFGKVSAEALSCGTPVICYDSTANKEIVGDECGYVIEKDDFNGVLECINKVRETGKKVFSDNCISRAQSLFEKKGRIDEYIDVFKQISKR